jgi:hypothetical protein
MTNGTYSWSFVRHRYSVTVNRVMVASVQFSKWWLQLDHGSETAYPSEAPELTCGFSEARVARSLVFCAIFCRSLFALLVLFLYFPYFVLFLIICYLLCVFVCLFCNPLVILFWCVLDICNSLLQRGKREWFFFIA